MTLLICVGFINWMTIRQTCAEVSTIAIRDQRVISPKAEYYGLSIAFCAKPEAAREIFGADLQVLCRRFRYVIQVRACH
jgi:hypothetical protein